MSEAKQSGRAPGWRKGQSGNPSGRKKGVRNKATLLALALMENELNDIVRTIINAAKGGDMAAARLIVDKLVPAAKERPLSIALPDARTPQGIAEAQEIVLQAVGGGDLLPSEGSAVSAMLETKRRIYETTELEQRIAELEKVSGKKS